MSSLERKLKRKNKKSVKKELAKKVKLMGSLSDKCLTCEKSFDKMNKEQVKTWNVVVRQEEGIVRLYCPLCWDKAINVLQDFRKHIEERGTRKETDD